MNSRVNLDLKTEHWAHHYFLPMVFQTSKVNKSHDCFRLGHLRLLLFLPLKVDFFSISLISTYPPFYHSKLCIQWIYNFMIQFSLYLLTLFHIMKYIPIFCIILITSLIAIKHSIWLIYHYRYSTVRHLDYFPRLYCYKLCACMCVK